MPDNGTVTLTEREHLSLLTELAALRMAIRPQPWEQSQERRDLEHRVLKAERECDRLRSDVERLTALAAAQAQALYTDRAYLVSISGHKVPGYVRDMAEQRIAALDALADAERDGEGDGQ